MPEIPTVPFDPLTRGPLSGFGGLPDDQMPPVSYGTMAREPLPHVDSPAPRENPVLPPLWPVLSKDGDTYTVTVTRGVVVDNMIFGDSGFQSRDPMEISNIGEVFPVTVGARIYVDYEVDELGFIKSDPAPLIVIRGEEANTQHHDPPVGDETSGADGVTAVKLAQVIDDSGLVKLTMFEAGNNIQHHPIPTFKAAAGADTFKEYDLAEGVYRTKGLVGGTGITVLARADDILISRDGSGLSGKDLNLTIQSLQYNDSGAIIIGSLYTEGILYWREGQFIGDSLPEGAVETPDGLIEKTVTRLFGGT